MPIVPQYLLGPTELFRGDDPRAGLRPADPLQGATHFLLVVGDRGGVGFVAEAREDVASCPRSAPGRWSLLGVQTSGDSGRRGAEVDEFTEYSANRRHFGWLAGDECDTVVVDVLSLPWLQQVQGGRLSRRPNYLSSSRGMRMLRKALEELDEKTIANALGMSGISHRLNQGLMKKLAPPVVEAFEAGKLTHVNPECQVEILKLMESCKDYGPTFARGLVLKTPVSKRAQVNGTRTPWARADERKSDLLKKLREAEQQQDFCSGLYRQYTTNLVKLMVYARSLISKSPDAASFSDERPP